MKQSSKDQGRLLAKQLCAAMLLVCAATVPSLAAGEKAADWQTQFEEVARPASAAMELPMAQLEALLSRCETLKGALGSLDESARKVYGRRLQMTCDLYRFMLESRKAAGNAGEAPQR